MTNLDDLTLRARRADQELSRAEGEHAGVLRRQQQLTEELAELTDEQDILTKATELLNSLGEERQLKAQRVIETLVTRGLHTIFDETLSFHISMTVRGKSSVVDFFVRTTIGNKHIDTGVLEARGGGLAAIIGFLLRIVVLSLRAASGGSKILILDETFAHVSVEYLDGLGSFLQELIKLTDVQVIMVTHQKEFEGMADKVYRFSTKDGMTQVEAG